jgi:hypothetical protein
MRKVTQQAIAAFTNGKNFKDGNTEVQSGDGITHLLLHGNAIARKDAVALSINLCGWNTNTTRDRLNGLAGVSLSTKQGQAFLNGVAIPDNGWVKVS